MDNWLFKIRQKVKPYQQKATKILNKFNVFFKETLLLKITETWLYQKLVQPVVNLIIILFQTIFALNQY